MPFEPTPRHDVTDPKTVLNLSSAAFDKDRYAANLAEQKRINDEKAAVGAQIAELHAKNQDSGIWTAQEQAIYNIHTTNDMRLTTDGMRVDAAVNFDRQCMPAKRPDDDGRGSALTRFLQAGYNGLDAEEIKQQSEMFQRISGGKTGGLTGGDRMYIPLKQALRADPTAMRGVPVNTIRSDNDSAQESVQERVREGLVQRLSAFGGIREAVAAMSTVNGADYNEPAVDNTAQTGEWLADQSGAASDQDTANISGGTTFKAYTMTSKRIKIRREALEDVNFNFEGYVTNAVARRLNLTLATALVSGDGSGKATGLITTAAVGKTTAVNTGFTWEELTQLEESVNPAYLKGGEGPMGIRDDFNGFIGYIISYGAYFFLRRLKDSEGRPLFNMNLAGPSPIFSSLFDRDFMIDYSMAGVGAGLKPIVFGNFGHYLLRMVDGIEIFRFFDSGTVTSNEVHILAFMRCDGNTRGPTVAEGANQRCEAYKSLAVKA